MNTFFRAGLTLVAVTLCAAATPACGPASPAGSDAGSGTDAGHDAGAPEDAGPTDAGGSANCAPTSPTRHHSYVPCDLHPTTAARLIVMGDSISAGYGTSDPTGSIYPYTPLAYFGLLDVNDNSVWPTEMTTSLAAEFNVDGGVPTINVAVPGATTASMISSPDQRTSLDTKLFGSSSSVSGQTIVVITIGGNDLVAQLESDLETASDSNAASNLANAISNIRAVINYFTPAKFPDGVAIYLANVYDPSGGTGMLTGACADSISGGLDPNAVSDPYIEGILSNWESAYVSLATELNFSIVDAHGGFLTHGVTATNTYFYSDCIHPNNDGHNELRNLFFEAIDLGSYVAPDN